METALSIFADLLWFALATLWWLVKSLFWLLVWFVLPVVVVAVIAFRIAEHVIGRPVVQSWLKRRSLAWGKGAFASLRRAVFALSALPLRVLFWLVVYTVWHGLLSLLWRPRWSPWQRAWGRRWRPRQRAA